MKVKVHIRDAFAGQRYKTELAHHETEKESLTKKHNEDKRALQKRHKEEGNKGKPNYPPLVLPEPPSLERYPPFELEASSVQGLRLQVAEMVLKRDADFGERFRKRAYDEGFKAASLQGSIVVALIGEEGKDYQWIDQDGPLQEGGNYLAMEVFKGPLPFNVFRTVAMKELRPSLPCLPSAKGLTNLAPLETAGMTTEEFRHPWLGKDSQGRIQVNGISVFVHDTDEDFAKEGDDIQAWNPYKVFKDKDAGHSFEIPLEKYTQLLDQEGAARHEKDGVLLTKLTHNVGWDGSPNPLDPVDYLKKSKEEKKKAAKSGVKQAEKQTLFYSFVLPKGTNLSDHGMALVFDDLANRDFHCTLVRLNNPTHMIDDEEYSFNKGIMRLVSSRPNSQLSDDEVKNLLAPDLSRAQPETLPETVNGKTHFFFPWLAALFKLHHLVVKAQAKPRPLDSFRDDLHDVAGTESKLTDAEALYCGVLVLYEATEGDEEIYDTIQRAEASGYEVERMGDKDLRVLLAAADGVDVEEMSDKDEFLLAGAKEVLQRSAPGPLNQQMASLSFGLPSTLP